ncbi:MAG: response regulator [Pseudobdellovibrionaceae bacterium]
MMKTQSASAKAKKHVLLVDDDLEFSSWLASCLEAQFNVQVTRASSGYTAMNELLDRFFSLVILDWDLAGMSGFQALKQVDQALELEDRLPLREVESRIPVVVLSGHEPSKIKSAKREKKHFRIHNVLSKRHGMEHLCEAIGALLNPEPNENQKVAI